MQNTQKSGKLVSGPGQEVAKNSLILSHGVKVLEGVDGLCEVT